MSSRAKIPVILLTGYLGSGKTTYLNQLNRQPEFSNSLVVINEFGSVSIDHVLVETATETVFELSNGCVCCSVRSDLVETLSNLDLEQFDHVFIETTGIADPLPVFQALTTSPKLSNFLMPACIVTVVDALRGEALIGDHPEARQQAAIADQIFVSKTDLSEDWLNLKNRLASLNPTATFIDPTERIAPEDLLPRKSPKNAEYIPAHQHSDYQFTVLEAGKALSEQDLVAMLNLLVSRLGSSLLRIKGFAELEAVATPVTIQVTGAIIHEPEPAPNDSHKGILLVVITKGADPHAAKQIFDGFTSQPAPEVADRDALLANPLAILGSGL